MLLLTACNTAPAPTPTNAATVNNTPLPTSSLPTSTPLPQAAAPVQGAAFKGIAQTTDSAGFYTLGDPSARILMVYYSDFLCTTCRFHFQNTEPAIIDQYVKPGKVRISLRYVLNHGERSIRTSEASACTAQQGYGWQMHDILFVNQGEVWNTAEDQMPALMKNYAATLTGLDQAKFAACMDSRQTLKTLQDADAEQRTRGIVGQPIFEIEGKRLAGAQPIETFAAAFDAAKPDRPLVSPVP
jgi:protein-disulfide isomerase